MAMEATLSEHGHPDIENKIGGLESSIDVLDSEVDDLSNRLTLQEERPLNITIKGISMSGKSEITFTEVT